MAFSYTTYTGNGSTTQYAIPFGYIRREHVLATVAGAPATFTFVNSTTIQMTVAPANGAVVRVYRQTPLTAPLVDFADGSTLVAADLDTNANQSIYTQQELDDSLVDGLAGVIPNGDKGDITTSVNGSVWTIDAGAVTEAKIAAGAVTEAKVAASAVTETKIGAGAVTEAKIAAGAVTEAKIAADAVTEAKIAADAVTEAKIGTGAVSAAKIAAGAFTNSVSSTSTTTIATPSSVKTAYDLATTANTAAGVAQGDATQALSDAAAAQSTANAALPKAGGTMTGVITYAAAQPRIVTATAVASTSGTSIDFTGIPSWAKRINVILSKVSTNGSSNLLIQIGGGSIENTGYDSIAGSRGNENMSTAGYLITRSQSDGSSVTGSYTLFLIGSDEWIGSGVNTGGSDQPNFSAGSKTASGTIDRVRITTENGTDTFDAGLINIMYEG
jgi:hypothetical protein